MPGVTQLHRSRIVVFHRIDAGNDLLEHRGAFCPSCRGCGCIAVRGPGECPADDPSGRLAGTGSLHPRARRAVEREHRQRALRRHAVLGADMAAHEWTRRAGVHPSGRPCVPVRGGAERAASPRLAAVAPRRAELALVGRGRRRLQQALGGEQAQELKPLIASPISLAPSTRKRTVMIALLWAAMKPLSSSRISLALVPIEK